MTTAERPRREASSPVTTASPPLVLVAEDDPDILELVATCLRADGWEVLEAHDGRSALRIARERLPRVAVLDIRMPHVDGLEVARRLKGDRLTDSIALLVLTASVDGTQPEHVRKAGADAYLPKPFATARLCQTVRGLLQTG